KIVHPEKHSRFRPGAPIEIRALAVDPAGYIPRVEFHANDRLLGVSEIAFIQPPTNGTPILHEFVWEDAAEGEYILTARAIDSRGVVIVSPPVEIIVGEEAASPAIVEITRPKDGAVLPAGVPVEIDAIAIDPDGYI